MPDESIQLVLLPGLGGDRRMAHAQQSLQYTLICPDYLSFERGESLAAYARRFGEYLVQTRAIDFGRPVFIGGYSLGSAIAMELAGHWSARGLILQGLIVMGGPMSSDEIRLFPRLFGRWIAGWLPLWVYRVGTHFVAPIMRRISGLPESDVQLSRAMYASLPKGLFREAYRAISEWNGCAVTVAICRIHGELDHRIYCPAPGPNVLILPKTKHLVAQARPDAVNRAIKGFITHAMNGNE